MLQAKKKILTAAIIARERNIDGLVQCSVLKVWSQAHFNLNSTVKKLKILICSRCWHYWTIFRNWTWDMLVAYNIPKSKTIKMTKTFIQRIIELVKLLFCGSMVRIIVNFLPHNNYFEKMIPWEMTICFINSDQFQLKCKNAVSFILHGT